MTDRIKAVLGALLFLVCASFGAISLARSEQRPAIEPQQIETDRERLERLCRSAGMGPPRFENMGKAFGKLCHAPERLPAPKPEKSETMG